MPVHIEHKAISASAGSGKTFQLVNRYIELMANEVPPDHIAAFTFSRKAAGEIFNSVVHMLCEASISEDVARKTARRIGMPDYCKDDFAQLLRKFTESIHRLYIGTLDSFIIRILSSFPMELGISSSFQLMESGGVLAKSVQQELFQEMGNRATVNDPVQIDFIEAFKKATFGLEEKGLERNLSAFVDSYHYLYQGFPVMEAWGQRKRIWPDGSFWLDRTFHVVEAANKFESTIMDFSEKHQERWRKFIESVRSFDSSSPLSHSVNYILEKLIPVIEDLKSGEARINIDGKNYDLSSLQCQNIFELLGHVLKIVLQREMIRTQGIYQILNNYDALYDEKVRRNGKLSFIDAQYLLTGVNRYVGEVKLSRLSAEDKRLFIDYRLDSMLDHWLLDEFQDTSSLQWEVLSNLIDEVLQDTAGKKSFFYVGDVKQAIYGWRGGNAKLFGEILEKYDPLIKLQPMSKSFRSCQPVIDMVNKVFSSLPTDHLPLKAIEQWNEYWQHHSCDQESVPALGYSALIEPKCTEDKKKPDRSDRYQLVADIIKEINPLERRLSVAILVRSNDEGKEIVDYLRGNCTGTAIVHEGKAAIQNSPVVLVLLSLVKFAAHPGDTLAWRHLQMSPLNKYLVEHNLGRNMLSLQLLADIQESGFQDFIHSWGRRLNDALPLDEFGCKRLQDLENAAFEFDMQKMHDCNAFLRFIDNYVIDEPPAENAVRVMTIHQSKGLGFDIVILPELQDRTLTKGVDPDILISESTIKENSWILKMPRRLISQADPVLKAELKKYDEGACFESLCLVYVALTRARQALYMVTSYQGSGSKSFTAAKLLKKQLAGDSEIKSGENEIEINGEPYSCLYETGARNWYKQIIRGQVLIKKEISELDSSYSTKQSHRKRFVHVAPSDFDETNRNAGALFSTGTDDVLEIGNAVHSLFCKVSWFNETDFDKIIQDWSNRYPGTGSVIDKTVIHFKRALKSGEIREALSKQTEHVELWREKRFEIILNDSWITGVFDRVVIEYGLDGKLSAATIMDFKSTESVDESTIESIAERYRSQLGLYGNALAKMLAVDVSFITLRLLFTAIGKVYDL